MCGKKADDKDIECKLRHLDSIMKATGNPEASLVLCLFPSAWLIGWKAWFVEMCGKKADDKDIECKLRHLDSIVKATGNPEASLVLCLFPSAWLVMHTQVVQVNDSMYGFIGTDVVLHCSFANPLPSVKITQVTWQKATNGSKQNVAIYNPVMGVSVLTPYRERVEFLRRSFTDGTIRLSRLELEDEGVYICEFSTFPTGNRESQLNLTVMAKPTNWIEGTQAVLRAKKGQDDKVLVATCTSANGKPPSVVSWETRLKGEAEYQEIRNPNGTVTVISRYRLVPSREAHQQSLACIVNYHMDRFKESLTLNVQYEPEVTIEGFDGNWYLQRTDVKLTCKADANPPATEYHWTT
ncbi:PREDICTED: nectin-1-like [Galeopterus variegatus]|uniref:Nectin-1-like n=1 Tax=Galeopterus variegatus TaxID=482537 RepID=A0ABM0SH10_GALVR|nr:PREDICTED: nectin-1-like [Galeopterus variegatus]